ncbi:MAG: hypothetical protein QOJ64_1001 [Acidobacteriota bacterium]|jgi:hypothetical protein|nr:hypothetical protein [Acidobacteriota bacterium]
MAKNEGKRLPSGKIEADSKGFEALQAIAGYYPINSNYSMAAVRDAYDSLRAARDVELQTAKAAACAREKAVAQEWLFHNLMLGVKDQVIAQFGKDSSQVEALGLKRKSDYKPPRRRTNTAEQIS